MSDALERRVAAYADRSDAILRIGLGIVILLAGAHKLVAPGAWTLYAAPWIVAVWPFPMDLSMAVNGAVEVAFGLALTTDVYTTVAAAVVALSLVGVVVDLVAVAVATGEFVDVAIRDLGLVVLAVGVTLRSAAPGYPSGRK